MKFNHLNIGQHFEYQGESYIKTTPLVANHAETGKQKLIPRYADLKVETEATSAVPESINNDDKLTTDQVAHAISRHKQEFINSMTLIEDKIDSDTSKLLITQMENAYHNLYKQLDLIPK